MPQPQQEFDFSVPVQPMGSPLSRHCSSMGAAKAKEHAAQQALRVMEAYRVHGPLTDAEVEIHTGIQRSSVIPRRRELEKRGLVHVVGHRKNPASGVNNTTYGLAGAQ